MIEKLTCVVSLGLMRSFYLLTLCWGRKSRGSVRWSGGAAARRRLGRCFVRLVLCREADQPRAVVCEDLLDGEGFTAGEVVWWPVGCDDVGDGRVGDGVEEHVQAVAAVSDVVELGDQVQVTRSRPRSWQYAVTAARWASSSAVLLTWV